MRFDTDKNRRYYADKFSALPLVVHAARLGNGRRRRRNGGPTYEPDTIYLCSVRGLEHMESEEVTLSTQHKSVQHIIAQLARN